MLSIILICLLVKESIQLKDVRLIVPEAVIEGEDATLLCLFDLEVDKLYSVKWYRGSWEFFRYTPTEDPPFKQFKINGLKVRESVASEKQIVLENVPKEVSGMFSCEVTADQPSFFTTVKTGYLEVVNLPRKEPHIHGLRARYRLGDVLKANCTSKDSFPAANLTWYVNGRPADLQNVHTPRARLLENKHYTAHSSLRLIVNEKLFELGQLKVRCLANIHNIYHKSSEKSIALERKKSHLHFTTTTVLPFLQRELTGERPPETTLIFQSHSFSTFASMSSAPTTQKPTNLILITAIFSALLIPRR